MISFHTSNCKEILLNARDVGPAVSKVLEKVFIKTNNSLFVFVLF